MRTSTLLSVAQACIVEFGEKRPSNLQTLRAVKYVTQLFRLKLTQVTERGLGKQCR